MTCSACRAHQYLSAISSTSTSHCLSRPIFEERWPNFNYFWKIVQQIERVVLSYNAPFLLILSWQLSNWSSSFWVANILLLKWRQIQIFGHPILIALHWLLSCITSLKISLLDIWMQYEYSVGPAILITWECTKGAGFSTGLLSVPKCSTSLLFDIFVNWDFMGHFPKYVFLFSDDNFQHFCQNRNIFRPF